MARFLLARVFALLALALSASADTPWIDGVVKGRVLGTEGQVIRDAQITFVPDDVGLVALSLRSVFTDEVRKEGGHLPLDLLPATRTDEDGRFQVEGPRARPTYTDGLAAVRHPSVVVRAKGYAARVVPCVIRQQDELEARFEAEGAASARLAALREARADLVASLRVGGQGTPGRAGTPLRLRILE